MQSSIYRFDIACTCWDLIRFCGPAMSQLKCKCVSVSSFSYLQLKCNSSCLHFTDTLQQQKSVESNRTSPDVSEMPTTKLRRPKAMNSLKSPRSTTAVSVRSRSMTANTRTQTEKVAVEARCAELGSYHHILKAAIAQQNA